MNAQICTPPGKKSHPRPGTQPAAIPALRIREHVEGLILSGSVPPGERLNENALSTQLGVSRGAIREVTRQLAEAGLLTVIHNRGVFVREMSLEDVLHIYDVRAGLARVAGRLAAIRAVPAQVADLRALLRKMDAAKAKQNPSAYYVLNRQFHHLVFQMAKNPRLIDFEEATEREAALYLRRGVFSLAHLGESNQQHGQIVEAIAARDELVAARTFEHHVISGKSRMLDAVAAPA